MPWPSITDFTEAAQNPDLCFRGTDLETGQVAPNRRGLPLVYSGAFACVYQVSVADRTYAVRCFTREVSDQDARYGDLSNYLNNVAFPQSFVNFEYLEHGIRIKGDWYPIVKMDWVDGEQLSGFVGSRLDQPDTLRRLATEWRGGPPASMRGLRIAHNDLQHGNVMVQADGSIRLVDYDGMFLSGFRGERSPELGHKNYQHPQRSAEHYDENVDNFPSLVIYLSLLAVATDASLWDFHDDGDNLIFTRKDYADPENSELFGSAEAVSRPRTVVNAVGASGGVLRASAGGRPRFGDGAAGCSTQYGDPASHGLFLNSGSPCAAPASSHCWRLIQTDAWSGPINTCSACFHGFYRAINQSAGPNSCAPGPPDCSYCPHKGHPGPAGGRGGEGDRGAEAQRRDRGADEGSAGSRRHGSDGCRRNCRYRRNISLGQLGRRGSRGERW